MSDTVTIEVAYALPDKQRIEVVDVPAGTTAIEAVALSGIEAHFDGLIVSNDLKLGVWGKAVAHSRALEAGERVEIYRPLLVDPKEVRKQRAAKARAERES